MEIWRLRPQKIFEILISGLQFLCIYSYQTHCTSWWLSVFGWGWKFLQKFLIGFVWIRRVAVETSCVGDSITPPPNLSWSRHCQTFCDDVSTRDRDGSYHYISPHLIWPHFNWPHFIRLRTDCAVVGRGLGELGCFRAIMTIDDPIRRSCKQSPHTRSFQMTWCRLRWDEIRWMNTRSPLL